MSQKHVSSPLKGLRTQRWRLVQYMGIDALIILAAYSAVFIARSVTASLDYQQSLPAMLASTAGLVVLLLIFGVYQRIWTHTSGHGITVIITPVALFTAAQLVISLMLPLRMIPLSVLLLGNVLALVGFIAVRYRSRLISGLTWRWKAIWRREFPAVNTRVLIIGAGEAGQTLAMRLKHRFPQNDYHIIGLIDDDPKKQGMYVESCLVLGTTADLVEIAADQRIDLIVMAIHNISGSNFRKILTLCESTQAVIKVVPDVFELVNARHSAAMLRDVQPEDLIGRTTIARHPGIDMQPVTGKAILVTGAAGSIGAELSRQIMTYSPVKVVLLDNNESGLHDLIIELAARWPNAHIVPALVDITQPEALRRVFCNHAPQIVFHAAAYKHVDMMEYYPQEALRVNIGGTLNLAHLAQQWDVERFVLISSDKAVNPKGVMGASKRACEMLLHALPASQGRGTLFTSVRFGNVLNSRGSIIPTFNRQIDSGGPVTVTDPAMTRYFMSIPEAVNLIIHAACMTQGDDIYILKMGETVRIIELAERMIRLRGLRPNVDIPIKITGIRPGEKLHEELYTPFEQPSETLHPGIIQLNTWSDDFDARLFFDHLDALLDPETEGEVMPRLLDLIWQESKAVAAGD
jgi:FlaA1/EpsC-like NDP-sugar epimerase